MRKLILLLFMLFLCGCANHAGIEETAIVVGAAVDEKDGQIELTVETVNTVDAKEGSAKGVIRLGKAGEFHVQNIRDDLLPDGALAAAAD